MGTVGYLLDTHTFLWSVRESHKLSGVVKETLRQYSGNCFVSSISAYEILYKYRLGKLAEYDYVAENYLSILRLFGALELPVKTNHAYCAGKLDWEHRDPFDRFLAAQAILEDMILVTNDKVFSELPQLSVLW